MKRLLLAATGTGIFNGTAVGFVMDGNIVAIFTGIAATVGLTVAVASWIDNRIASKIRASEALAATRSYMQSIIILREISNLRELGGHPPIDIDQLLKQPFKEAG